MDTYIDVLLITANVGSLFDNVGEMQSEWIRELCKVGEMQSEWIRELCKIVHSHKPKFIALHFQEVGGKDYMVNMGHAENFVRSIESSEEMKHFDRSCIYVDSQFQAEESFTVEAIHDKTFTH